MHPLDRLVERDLYGRHFTDEAFWKPYIRQACAAHGLPCRSVKAGTPGSFPVFIVDRRLVVKFFGPLFEGERSHAAELEVARRLQQEQTIPCARVLFCGKLDPPGAQWNWPYLGFEYLAGQSISEVFDRIPLADWASTLHQLGRWMRVFHRMKLTGDGAFENTWDGFERFLQGQVAGCAARQAAWGSLPPYLVRQIDDFLPPVSSLVDRAVPPHWIHADLTGDHLIGSFQRGHWVVNGLIDFGDARVGSLYYELAALHMEMLRGDRRLLRAFLDGYGFQPPANFPRLALSTCLLHPFNLFTRLPEPIPTTLDELACRLWEV